jgi:hypothetical protein
MQANVQYIEQGHLIFVSLIWFCITVIFGKFMNIFCRCQLANTIDAFQLVLMHEPIKFSNSVVSCGRLILCHSR